MTDKKDKPKFDMGQTVYGRVDDKVFIFMNVGILGSDGLDYKNHYDP